MATKLIIGCGYLGSRLAERWIAAGNEVYALTRGERKGRELADKGVTPIVGDVTLPRSLDPLRDLPDIATLLYAVGFDAAAGAEREMVIVQGLAAVLDALPQRVGRIIFISTTGVYGDAGGDWVDEGTDPQPRREAGGVALAAERLLQSHPLGQRAIILRLAGIYGPERIPYLKDIEAGQPIAARADGYLNLIHVDDAVNTVLAAEQRGAPPAIYLVSDGRPLTRREYATEIARQLGAPPPQFREPSAEQAAASRGGDDKRISNARLRAELNPALDERPYAERLADLLAGLRGDS